MNWFTRTFSYSIGKKIIMSLTGLFLVAFLIEHVIGNFLLFANDNGEAFNQYSHDMTHNMLIRIVEIFLFLGIIFHAADGIWLWFSNRKARPIRYQKVANSENTMWSSRNMIVTGTILLFFIVIHLKEFFVPYRITHDMGGHTLYEITRDAFHNPWYAGFYVICMVLLGLHLHHGFASAFQTLGLRHPNYYGAVKFVGVFLSVVICGGFASMPIYFFLNYIMG
jgi:succinate dehydrogenase / fumarate reductase cytochrome b subunit